MAGDFDRLLLEVSRELAGATRDVATAMRRVEQLAEEHGNMRERIRALEMALAKDDVAGEREHSALRDRLAEGERIFEILKAASSRAQEAADTATAAANSAQHRVKDLQAKLEEAEKLRGARRWDLVQIGISAAVGGIGFFLAWALDFLKGLAK